MKIKAYVGAMAIALAAFLWALDGVVLTPYVMELGLFDVPIFVFLLHATASIFLIFFFIKKKKELSDLKRGDWTAFLLVAIFGGALGTMAIVGAILMVYSQGLNISVVLLLQKLQPIFAILLAFLLLKERPRPQFYLWAVIAIVGSYFLTFGFVKPNISANGMTTPALLAILAAFSFGSSTVFSKRAIKKVSHEMGTTLRFFLTTGVMFLVISGVSLLHIFGIETPYAGFSGFSVITPKIIGTFILIALTTGGTAIYIYYYGLKRVLASRSTMYEMVFPISAIFLEWIIHDKILLGGQWVGAIIMLVAIVSIARQRSKT